MLFTLGKRAYAKGQYVEASELLFQALEETGNPFNKLGGDIQLWLGLAYQVGKGIAIDAHASDCVAYNAGLDSQLAGCMHSCCARGLMSWHC